MIGEKKCPVKVELGLWQLRAAAKTDRGRAMIRSQEFQRSGDMNKFERNV